MATRCVPSRPRCSQGLGDPEAVPVPLIGWPDAPPARVIAPDPKIEYFTHEKLEC